MDATFKFRFVNEITGAFVLLAAALLVTGVFMAGRAQGLFERKFKLHVIFTSAEGSFGLKKGSEIRILSAPAGMVDQIEPTPDGAIKAVFILKERFHGFVRTSSRAIVKKTLVVTGDAYVEISVGDRNDPMIPDGGTIDCSKDREIVEQATVMLDELRAQTIPALEKIQLFLDEMPDLAAQAQSTLREAQILMQGLERHWLLRKYIEPVDSYYLIAPVQTGSLQEEIP